MKWHALLLDKTCNAQSYGHEVLVTRDGKPWAVLLNACSEAQEDAREAIRILNATEEPVGDGRPPRAIRLDRGERFNDRCIRNREHIRKTFDLNMRLADERWKLADHCHRVAKDDNAARRWAAECYAMKSFVTGIIEGRGYELPEAEITALKHEWEEGWDKNFGDLVYELLNVD